jgi:hypothetical protein
VQEAGEKPVGRSPSEVIEFIERADRGTA